jgi:hypothetical protein
MKAFMEEQGIRYRKRKVLDMPSWTPPDMPHPTDEESTNGGDEAKGATIFTPPPLPPATSAAEPAPVEPTAADFPPPAYARVPDQPQPIEAPPPPNRFVLLAAFAEIGTPPPGLQSSTKLIAVALPENSSLTTLFQAGRQYRFASDKFEGHYRVLEAFPTAREALLIYPEGLPVDPAKGDFLHWQEFGDATSADASAWTALH